MRGRRCARREQDHVSSCWVNADLVLSSTSEFLRARFTTRLPHIPSSSSFASRLPHDYDYARSRFSARLSRFHYRSSAALARVVVSPRFASSSWTTPRVPSSATSRAPSASTTSSLSSSRSVRPGEYSWAPWVLASRTIADAQPPPLNSTRDGCRGVYSVVVSLAPRGYAIRHSYHSGACVYARDGLGHEIRAFRAWQLLPPTGCQTQKLVLVPPSNRLHSICSLCSHTHIMSGDVQMASTELPAPKAWAPPPELPRQQVLPDRESQRLQI